MASDMKPEERARRIVGLQFGATVEAAAKEIREAEQQARKEAFEEAAKLCEENAGAFFESALCSGLASMIRSRAKEDQSRG